jgi:hypothetical protein
MQASLLSATFLSGSAATTTTDGLTGAGTTAGNANGQPSGLFDSLLPQQQAVASSGTVPATLKSQSTAPQTALASDDMAQAGPDGAVLAAEPVDAAAIAPANTQLPTEPVLSPDTAQLQSTTSPAPSILDQAARAEAMLEAASEAGRNAGQPAIPAAALATASETASPATANPASATPGTVNAGMTAPVPAFSAPPATVTTAAAGQTNNPAPGGLTPPPQTSVPQANPAQTSPVLPAGVSNTVSAPVSAADANPVTSAAAQPATTLDTSALEQTARANGQVAQVETARADAFAGRFNQRAEWLSSRVSADGNNGAALAAALNAGGQPSSNAAVTPNTALPASPLGDASVAPQPGKQPTMGVMTGDTGGAEVTSAVKMAVSKPVTAPTGVATPQAPTASVMPPATPDMAAASATPPGTATSSTLPTGVQSSPAGTNMMAPATPALDPLQSAEPALADLGMGKPQTDTVGAKAGLKPDATANAAKGVAFTSEPVQPRPASQPVPGAALTAPAEMSPAQAQPGMTAEAAAPAIAPASAPGVQLKQKNAKAAATGAGATTNTGAKPASASAAAATSAGDSATLTAASTASTATKPVTQPPMPADTLPPPTLPLDGGSGLRAEPDLTLNRMDARPTGLERSTTPDGARFTPQTATNLAAQIQRRFVNGARVFDIRLDPAELGRVDVRLELSPDQRVQAILTIERPETLAEMQRNARELERALAEAGLDVGDDGLEFQLGGDTHWEDAEDQLDEDMIPVFQESEYLDLAETAVEPQAEREAYGFRLAGGRDRLDMRI